MATETVTLTEAPIIDATINEISEESKKESISSAIQHLNMSTDVGMTRLTPKEKEECKELAKTLDMRDVSSIMNYGSDAQNALNRYGNAFLENNRTSMAGELGGLIDNLFDELDGIDYHELSKPSSALKIARSLPIVRHFVSSVSKIVHKYDNMQKKVEGISKNIEVGRLGTLQENNALQVMFDKNVSFIKRTDKLIYAANEKLQEVNATLEEMMANKDKYEMYEIGDVQTFKDMLERKITDIVTVRYAMKQTLPQIRMVQQNNCTLANKAQTVISTTLPLWKNALALAVSLQNQKKFTHALNKVDETTNRLLTMNIDTLADNSKEIAEANQRGIIELETLRHTTAKMIDMMKEVQKINSEAVAKRNEIVKEIRRLDLETDATLTSMQQALPSMSNSMKQLGY